MNNLTSVLANNLYPYTPLSNIFAARENNVPGYNLESLDENNYVMEVSVAGFSESDIDLKTFMGFLEISGKTPSENSGRNYIHNGLKFKEFSYKFKLSEYVLVDSASYSNGILRIKLVRSVPDVLQPRKIEIKTI